jgi:hypothetical protein
MALDATVNFAKSPVSGGYSAGATAITLAAGGGAKFPAVPFNAVWWNSTDFSDPSDDPTVEIVRVTNIAVDVLTVTRGQEGTAAVAHSTAGKTYSMIEGLTSAQMTIIATAFANTGAAGEVWSGPAGAGGAPGFNLVSLVGSAALTFGLIPDGSSAALTLTIAGAVVGQAVAPEWPSTLEAGLLGIMFVSAANTITVRLFNLSGAGVTPAVQTFGARIPLY